jgi:hypothetical protein
LNLQIFIAFFEKDCHALLAMTREIARNDD